MKEIIVCMDGEPKNLEGEKLYINRSVIEAKKVGYVDENSYYLDEIMGTLKYMIDIVKTSRFQKFIFLGDFRIDVFMNFMRLIANENSISKIQIFCSEFHVEKIIRYKDQWENSNLSNWASEPPFLNDMNYFNKVGQRKAIYLFAQNNNIDFVYFPNNI